MDDYALTLPPANAAQVLSSENMSQFGIRELLERNPIVPVVTFNAMGEVDSQVEKLLSKGISCIEITLRTPVALEAIAHVKSRYKDEIDVGVGTLVNSVQLKHAKDIGVDFIVSPGLLPHLRDELQEAEIAFIPGVVTPSEIIAGMAAGYDTFKFFPAMLSGGIKMVKAYGNVFPEVRFCPTGGINADNHQDFLNLPNVISVGGSWVV